MVVFFCSAFHLKPFILPFIFLNILIITMILKSMTDNSNIWVNCVSVSIMHHFSWSCFLLHLLSLNKYGHCMYELRFWMMFSFYWGFSHSLAGNRGAGYLNLMITRANFKLFCNFWVCFFPDSQGKAFQGSNWEPRMLSSNLFFKTPVFNISNTVSLSKPSLVF